MTANSYASFDVSQYIPELIRPFERSSDLVCFTPSNEQNPHSLNAWDYSGLPGFKVAPATLPLCIQDYAVQQYPRGIPYDKFPISTDPYCALIDPLRGRSALGETATLSWRRVESMIQDQHIFVYDEVGYSDHLTEPELQDALYLAIRAHRVLGVEKPFYYRQKGNVAFTQITPSEIEAQSAGWQRFRYSYRINFRAITRKAFTDVNRRYPCPDYDSMKLIAPYNERVFASWQKSYVEGRLTPFSDPIALQILFCIRSLTTRQQAELSEIYQSLPNRIFRPCTQMTFGGRIEGGLWFGSGKYKFGFDVTDDVYKTIWQARAIGFVTDDRDGLIGLTEAGQTFLDCLHTDNDDPDALHRFMDPQSKSMPSSEIDRIDAWMMRFFRKMKTKVNALT